MVPVLPEIFEVVDFVSVGTNDLVQYLLAVDRDNQRVAKMYDPFHPGVLRVLSQIAEAALASGKSASICGEIAGDHWFAPLLIGLGFRELSMAPVFLPRAPSKAVKKTQPKPPLQIFPHARTFALAALAAAAGLAPLAAVLPPDRSVQKVGCFISSTRNTFMCIFCYLSCFSAKFAYIL